jgi:hypothetical protein
MKAVAVFFHYVELLNIRHYEPSCNVQIHLAELINCIE